MKRASISELKARLSAYLDLVRQGDDVIVTDRGRVIARLTPVRGDLLDESRRDDLLASGRMRSPRAPLPSDFWERKRPVDAEGRSLDALLEERREGW